MLDVAFLPTGFGAQQAALTVTASDGSMATVALSGTGTGGYYLAGAAGETAAFGDAPQGAADPRSKFTPASIVGIAATVDGEGTWTASADGAVYPSGDAVSAGELSGTPNEPVVGIAADTSLSNLVSTAPSSPSSGISQGYWLVASDGGVFAFDAPFLGSEGGTNLNEPIVGMAATPDGGGYWLVAADGGIFSFGDAQFYGSTGALDLNQPIVGMATTPDGGGYWLVGADGGIFSFGDAQYFGSEGGTSLSQPIVGMASTPDGQGYWLLGKDGGIFSLGDAAYFGSLPALTMSTWQTPDVVGMATTTQPLLQQLESLSAASAHTHTVTNLNAFAGRVRIVTGRG